MNHTRIPQIRSPTNGRHAAEYKERESHVPPTKQEPATRIHILLLCTRGHPSILVKNKLPRWGPCVQLNGAADARKGPSTRAQLPAHPFSALPLRKHSIQSSPKKAHQRGYRAGRLQRPATKETTRIGTAATPETPGASNTRPAVTLGTTMSEAVCRRRQEG